ncbi:tyrosine-type recombinase/integrase [Bacillus safensis]|uniref:tyrosine-type recombinase/integrase n=1 Tax=Bacillus safensis TaxID=561879 RepID=UPI003AA8D637
MESFVKTHNLHPITVHGFRHMHASILFEAGATVKEVQVRLGRRDIKTTINIYTHVTKTVKERTAELFQTYINI